MSLVIRTWISDEHFVSQTAVQDTLNEAEGSQPVFHPRQNSFECSDEEDNTSSGTNSVTENHVTENSDRTSDTTGDAAVTAVAQRGNQVIMVFQWHPALVAMLVIKHKIFCFSLLGTKTVFFYTNSAARINIVLKCTSQFKTTHVPPLALPPRKPPDIWLKNFGQIPWYVGSLDDKKAPLGSPLGSTLKSIKSPMHQQLFKNFPVHQTFI